VKEDVSNKTGCKLDLLSVKPEILAWKFLNYTGPIAEMPSVEQNLPLPYLVEAGKNSPKGPRNRTALAQGHWETWISVMD
jgi:hypothetical protein